MFVLVTEHGLTDCDPVLKGSIYAPFAVPDADDDIETLFIKPIIMGMERCRDKT